MADEGGAGGIHTFGEKHPSHRKARGAGQPGSSRLPLGVMIIVDRGLAVVKVMLATCGQMDHRPNASQTKSFRRLLKFCCYLKTNLRPSNRRWPPANGGRILPYSTSGRERASARMNSTISSSGVSLGNIRTFSGSFCHRPFLSV